MDLSTRYLGLVLPHPFLPGASPLTQDLDTVLRLEDAGAPALVMHSLFEEDLTTQGAEPHQYLEQLLRIRRRTGLPVIASLNGTTAEGWLRYAKLLERAGAAALELNFYHVATDPLEDAAAVEHRVIDIVAVLKESIGIPLAVKLSPFFSALPQLAATLDALRVDGLVLFNRFYQPDIDPERRCLTLSLRYSDSSELLLRLSAIAILAGRVNASLGLTGGVHEPIDAVKAILAGADVVQIVSALMKRGPGELARLRDGFVAWADQHACESVREMRGTVSLARCKNPKAFERGNYMQVLRGTRPPDSPDNAP
jgi:dihydroorotate dehydrogenase (fumarate)